MVIYKVTNKINGKIYIGQTMQKPKRRWLDHILKSKKPGRKTRFHSTLKKYGEEGFTWEIIAEANTQEELDKLEIKFIKELKAYDPYGYNLKEGGDGGRHSEKSKKAMSDAGKPKAMRELYKFDENGNFIKKFKSHMAASKEECVVIYFPYGQRVRFSEKNKSFYAKSIKDFKDYKNENFIVHLGESGEELGIYRTALLIEEKLGYKNPNVCSSYLNKRKMSDGTFFLKVKDATPQVIDRVIKSKKEWWSKKVALEKDGKTYEFDTKIEACEFAYGKRPKNSSNLTRAYKNNKLINGYKIIQIG